MPVVLQSEANECGLACLAMIAARAGVDPGLSSLRRRFAVPSRGTSLRCLIDIAGVLGMTARPVRLEIDELADLKLPCILHWDINHFVVLAHVSRKAITINDPARGRRQLTMREASRHFTGVALELQPGRPESAVPPRRRISLSSIADGAAGLKRRLLTAVPISLSLEAVLLATPILTQWIVDGAVVASDRDLLLLLAIGSSLLVIVQAAIGLARSWVVIDASTQLSLHWSNRLFSHLLRLPVQWFERRSLGDIASRFSSMATINRTLSAGFAEALIDGLMACVTLALMMVYSPALAMIASASALLYALARVASLRSLQELTTEQIAFTAKANSLLLESVRAIASIKLFNREQARHAWWMNATAEAANRALSAERHSAVTRATQVLTFGIENVLIIALGAAAVMDGVFSIGMLLAFLTYRTIFSTRVAALVDKWIQLQMLAPHRDRLEDIALEPAEDADPEVLRTGAPRDLNLEMKGVWFRYGDADPWVLKDITLSIKPGEFVAITGASGCGKTTLLRLMMGLLRPCRGEIFIGGVCVDALGLREYRRRIAGVLQEDDLLAGSIAENVAYLDSPADASRIEECARMASIHDDIRAMPMGYETRIGDTGSSLSGGQKQRILLARALYKRPELLFLDEATSHLDIANEQAVSESMSRLRLTRIVVAHRPETIASAERVIAMEDGTITADVRVSPAFASAFPRAAGQPDQAPRSAA